MVKIFSSKPTKRYLLIILCCLLAGYGLLILYNSITHSNIHQSKSKSNNTIRIATANIHYENLNTIETTRKLHALNADILIILEYSGDNLNLLWFEENGYQAKLQKPMHSPHGICVLTKKEMQIESALIKNPHVNPCQMEFATLRFRRNNQTISVWGIHAPPPVPSCRFLTGPSIETLSTYVLNGKLIKPLGVSQPDDLIIMAGDFNIFWFHPAILKLKNKGLQDAYAEKHLLPAVTWSHFTWFQKFVGLDYIICSKKFKVTASSIFQIRGSDHSGVVADIRL